MIVYLSGQQMAERRLRVKCFMLELLDLLITQFYQLNHSISELQIANLGIGLLGLMV